MIRSGPFTLNDLPHGWSVAWPDYEHVVVNNPKKLTRLLEMLFDELKLDQAQLGILLNNGEFEIYHIDSMLWYGRDSRDQLVEHVLGTFTIAGVKFDDESPARKFLAMMEKRYIWLKLGGAWA